MRKKLEEKEEREEKFSIYGSLKRRANKRRTATVTINEVEE